jgi:hypothetical protein
MKHIRKVAVMTFVLLLAVSAFAADKSTVNLTLNTKSTVNGTTLVPGDYKVLLDRNGDAVQATFVSRGKTVATSSGHFESRSGFGGAVSVVLSANDRAIQQILVQKMKGAIVLDNGTPSAGGH